jgi:hypothetical protein
MLRIAFLGWRSQYGVVGGQNRGRGRHSDGSCSKQDDIQGRRYYLLVDQVAAHAVSTGQWPMLGGGGGGWGLGLHWQCTLSAVESHPVSKPKGGGGAGPPRPHSNPPGRVIGRAPLAGGVRCAIRYSVLVFGVLCIWHLAARPPAGFGSVYLAHSRQWQWNGAHW